MRVSARPVAAAVCAVAVTGLLVSIAALWPATRPAQTGQPTQTAKTAGPAQTARPAEAALEARDTAGAVAGPLRRGGRPVQVVVPSAGLDLAVRPVGVADDGQMRLPTDPAVLGWYRFGPGPGALGGAVVLAGHLDSWEYGVGPLVRLREVRPDDRILVADAGGRRSTYVVAEVRRYDRQRLPDRLFARSGPVRVHLITCGGSYEADRGGYQQNLVVTAVPE